MFELFILLRELLDSLDFLINFTLKIIIFQNEVPNLGILPIDNRLALADLILLAVAHLLFFCLKCAHYLLDIKNLILKLFNNFDLLLILAFHVILVLE
jgi:hypothetical protein